MEFLPSVWRHVFFIFQISFKKLIQVENSSWKHHSVFFAPRVNFLFFSLTAHHVKEGVQNHLSLLFGLVVGGGVRAERR